MAPKTRFFAIALALALPLDQLTKRWIVANFHYGENLTVISGFFDLTHVRNPGGAFSLFASGSSEYRLAFFLVAGAIAVSLLVVFYRRLPPDALISAAALGVMVVLPIGGADMPVVISLLNAFTGLSAAATGLALDNTAMIVAGMIVGASGTGIQEISCLIARHGGGVSHAIGVGGRDLSQEVGGITTLMAMDMLDEGTTSRTSLEISEELAMIGAELSTASTLDTSVVSLSALKENLDASLDIFADVVRNPAFAVARAVMAALMSAIT